MFGHMQTLGMAWQTLDMSSTVKEIYDWFCECKYLLETDFGTDNRRIYKYMYTIS